MKSELCTYDLKTGHVSVLLASERLIEAPNWAPDGNSLIVNGDGRLFRVDLAAPDLLEIDTGFATACNNDHGISPDGRWLAISDKTETGQSTIYTLPVSGGRPVRITGNTPSYWHGWSPDGKTLTYVGRRDGGAFSVFTIAVAGGEETCLTEGFEHTDGPDYAPDGRSIWFNGQKDGRMQLWRIGVDGTGATQMTDDGFCNWFAHPSPDGKHVLYLAYLPGTTGHPRDRDVELRLLPAAGGAARTLISLFGGQGTINVPCWAPAGHQFAFMRYGRPKN